VSLHRRSSSSFDLWRSPINIHLDGAFVTREDDENGFWLEHKKVVVAEQKFHGLRDEGKKIFARARLTKGNDTEKTEKISVDDEVSSRPNIMESFLLN
jgi:hypothetical protein